MDLAQHRTTPMQTQDTIRVLGRIKATPKAPALPPSAEEFARADEHLPAGTKAAGYLRSACCPDAAGALLPVVIERHREDGRPDPLDTFWPLAFGRFAGIGFNRRRFLRLMMEGRAWHASAKGVAAVLARALDPARVLDTGDDEPITPLDAFLGLPRAYSGDLTSTAGEGRYR